MNGRGEETWSDGRAMAGGEHTVFPFNVGNCSCLYPVIIVPLFDIRYLVYPFAFLTYLFAASKPIVKSVVGAVFYCRCLERDTPSSLILPARPAYVHACVMHARTHTSQAINRLLSSSPHGSYLLGQLKISHRTGSPGACSSAALPPHISQYGHCSCWLKKPLAHRRSSESSQRVLFSPARSPQRGGGERVATATQNGRPSFRGG